MNEIITQDGEVIEGLQTLTASASMAVQQHKAEIDQLVTTARQYPRSLKRVQSAILSMATLDEESAEECIYALPRGGKPIKGPSIRFAEILKQSYGNCRAAARVVNVDKSEGYVEAEGVFHDLETNSASTARVRRRILDRRGKVYNDDMIIVTGNAACSIAMRNAILAGVPKPLWRKAYEQVQSTITGDITTLAENREKAFKALAAFGVKPEQVFQALGVEGEEDIAVDHIATLRGMYAALKNGEATVEEMFVGTVKAVSDHQKVANPLADEPAEKTTAKDEPDSAEAPEQQTSSDLTPSDEQGSGDQAPTDAAADPSASQGDESEAGSREAADGQSAASASHDLSEEDRKWLTTTARMLWAATGQGEQDLLKATFDGIRENKTPEAISRAARDKGNSIFKQCKLVCFGEADSSDTLELIAGIAGVEPEELVNG